MELVSKGNYIFDTESDGFLWEATRIWWACLRDIDTNKVHIWFEGDLGWIEFIEKNAKKLVGSNLIGHDLMLLYKLFKWVVPEHIKVVDTMLMSQVQDYKRFGERGHSLEVWGEFLKRPKIVFDPAKFKNPTPEDLEEMKIYCIGDTDTNREQYLYLCKELTKLLVKSPLLTKSLDIEHDTAWFVAWAEYYGWLFDKDKAQPVYDTLCQAIQDAESRLNPLLKPIVKPVDKAPMKAKFNKDGRYNHHVAKWFGLDPEDGKLEIPPVKGEYSRIEFVQPDATSMEAVKALLYSIGWEPDDWNYKRVDGQFVKVSPKLSESSLLPLGEIGALVNDLTTDRSRCNILRGWLEELDENNRLHGSCFTISTPTGRARHAGIVNIPSGNARWGPEIRSLFIANPGRKVVGADSSGNQFRALCHYLKNDTFTDLVLNGDVHQANADILSNILKQTVKRSTSKPFIYASKAHVKLCEFRETPARAILSEAE